MSPWMPPKLKAWLGAASWWIWPPRCIGCGRLLADPAQVFCSTCSHTILPISPPLCPTCFLPFEAGESHICAACLRDPPPFERAVAVFEYGGAVASAIRRLKYGPAEWIARELGSLLAGHLAALDPDLVCPVPTHPAAVRRRGFDHALELARWACRAAGLPGPRMLLDRMGSPEPQAAKSLAQRRRLGASAFTLRRAVAGRHVVLVDDVLTTTATARAASRVLVRAGARVSVAVVARTIL